jgi:hypothetical protein
MSREDADLLQELIEAQQTVTVPHEQWVQRQVAKFAALRESDRDYLKKLKNWPADRDYIVDPLPERIAEAFADFLFGEDPVFTAADNDAANPEAPEEEESGGAEPTEDRPKAEVGEDDASVDDQDRLDDLIDANSLPSELHQAAAMFTAEGEVWWRIYRDDDQSDFPIIEWHSRSHVRPLFRGRKLVAAAFVSDIHQEKVEDQLITYKYVEIQTEGYVRNLLYKGTTQGQLGSAVPLSQRPETKDLEEEWDHQLGMLAGRVADKMGRDRRYAISTFVGIEDLLFSLNEATTIGHENARLTLKRRLAIPREALNASGKFDAGEDVLVMDDPLDEELGANKQTGKFAVLEYSFDAPALISYKNDLSSIILTRVGLARQLTDPNTNEGTAASGTALRVRLIPTTMAAKGKARPFDDELPRVLMLAQQVDNLPKEKGGFGRSWNKAGEPPIVERSDPLPADETEETNRHAVAVSSEFESRETAIKTLHPDWTDKQVQDELDKIFSELATFQSIGGGGGPGGQPPGPGEPAGGGPPNDAAAQAASLQDGGTPPPEQAQQAGGAQQP